MKKFSLYVGHPAHARRAGVAYSAASPSAKVQKQDRVYCGGHIDPGCFTNSGLCFEAPRNFAVDAHAQGDGSEAAGNSNYGATGAFEAYRGVTCLRLSGNTADVGGIIESGTNTNPLSMMALMSGPVGVL